MNEKDKSKLIAIILVIVTIVVVILSNVFEKKDTKDVTDKISILSDYTDFYTVDSCLYRTITYISAADKKSLLLVLSENYKVENNIDETNVMNVFGKIEENSTFISRKMYYQNISENITKYYVYGYIQLNQIFDDFETNQLNTKDMYFVVYMDKTNKTFSIEPITKDIFLNLGGDSNEG